MTQISAPYVLKIRKAVKNFGGFNAVNNIDLDVTGGSVHAIIGPNGAGKTTLINLISGFIPSTSGSYFFKGIDLKALRPDQRAAIGISRTFQNIRLFPEMTVRDNVMIARFCRQESSLANLLFKGLFFKPPFVTIKVERDLKQRAEELLDLFGILHRKEFKAANLPFGEQKLLEMAQALASEPELLLLDEPVAGMNPTEKENVKTLIRKISDMGTTVLFIEHDMRVVMDVSDLVTVINFGTKIAEGTPPEIKKNPVVIEAYLGAEG